MLRFSFFSVCFLINIFSRERESVQILVSIVFISFTSNYLGWWSPLINCKELKVFQKAPSIHIRSASYGTLFCWHNWSIVGASTVVGKDWLVVWHVFPPRTRWERNLLTLPFGGEDEKKGHLPALSRKKLPQKCKTHVNWLVVWNICYFSICWE